MLPVVIEKYGELGRLAVIEDANGKITRRTITLGPGGAVITVR